MVSPDIIFLVMSNFNVVNIKLIIYIDIPAKIDIGIIKRKDFDLIFNNLSNKITMSYR